MAWVPFLIPWSRDFSNFFGSVLLTLHMYIRGSIASQGNHAGSLHNRCSANCEITKFKLHLYYNLICHCQSLHVKSIRYRQIFSGGGAYRTKMKIWSENFSRTSGTQKRASKIFHLRWPFFHRGGTENRSKTIKNR